MKYYFILLLTCLFCNCKILDESKNKFEGCFYIESAFCDSCELRSKNKYFPPPFGILSNTDCNCTSKKNSDNCILEACVSPMLVFILMDNFNLFHFDTINSIGDTTKNHMLRDTRLNRDNYSFKLKYTYDLVSSKVINFDLKRDVGSEVQFGETLWQKTKLLNTFENDLIALINDRIKVRSNISELYLTNLDSLIFTFEEFFSYKDIQGLNANLDNSTKRVLDEMYYRNNCDHDIID